MADATITPAIVEAADKAQPSTSEETREQLLVDEDLVIEEVSIDGMCGVY